MAGSARALQPLVTHPNIIDLAQLATKPSQPSVRLWGPGPDILPAGDEPAVQTPNRHLPYPK